MAIVESYGVLYYGVDEDSDNVHNKTSGQESLRYNTNIHSV